VKKTALNGNQLKSARLGACLTQSQVAAKLGVSQPYLSLMESGVRRVPERMVRSVARLLNLSPAVLPVPEEPGKLSGDLSHALAALGYPGYSYLRVGRRINPALAVFQALSQDALDARVAQGLPWVLLQHPGLNWSWLVSNARRRNLQNKLGFLVAVAREVAERVGRTDSAATLAAAEQTLETSRLAAETTLGKEAMPSSERAWLRVNRPPLAKHWNVLTSLSPEHLPYAA
jgi:transcriptional regulator with XRE-family HTH domain